MAKISELIKILRGEGNVAGARRAERIGDEAPYAVERLDENELRRTLSGLGDNAESLTLISPEDFRYLAEQLPQEYVDRPSTQKHIQDLQKIAQEKGFRDIPFLSYNEYPGVNELGVFGHEGRHRMRALENLGDEKALVRLIPRGDVREPLPRRYRSEFLQALAEKYGDPLYLDPESYNQQVIPMKSRLRSALLKKPTAAERAGANFDMEEFRKKYGYTGRKPVQPFAGGGLAKFFSAVDEAVANLRQKKGTGEQMLKEIQKAPGVKKEELELRRLPEKLAGQQKVTQEDIQAMLKAVPAPKVQLTQRGGKGLRPTPPDLYNWVAERPGQRGSVVDALERRGYEITQNPEDPQTIGFISPDGDIVGMEEIEDLLETEREMAVDARVQASRAYQVAADNLANMYEVDGSVKPQFRDQIEEAKRAVDNLVMEELEARELNQNITETRRELRRFMNDWRTMVAGAAQTDAPKFENFTTKGPKENYRELLIQLEKPAPKKITRPPFAYNRQGLGGDPIEVSPQDAVLRLGLTDSDELGYDAESVLFYPTGNYIVKRKDGKYYSEALGEEILKNDLSEVESWLARKMEGEMPTGDLYEPQPRSYVNPSHFPEPDILVHARVDDRVGPNGEKILYVEEIQSDWHQDARKVRLEQAKENVRKGSVQDAIAQEARIRLDNELGAAENSSISPQERAARYVEIFGEVEDAKIKEEAAKLPKDFGYKQMGTRVAPFSQTSHELAVKQILDTAANEGYDKVMFAPGSEQVKRYSLGEYFAELKVNSVQTGDGTRYNVSGTTKEGGTLSRTFSKKELIENIGEDKAKLAIERIEENRAAGSQAPAVLTGEDLLVGGKKAQGKLKIYDEIIPSFVSKYAGKEFNVQPGKTAIDVENLPEDVRRRNFADQFMQARVQELTDAFEAGNLPEEIDIALQGPLMEKAREDVIKEFTGPVSRLRGRFAKEFAPRVESRPGFPDIDYKGLLDELDPESYGADMVVHGYGPETSPREIFALLDPRRIKFRDPAKQESFQEWLDEVVMAYSGDPFTVDAVARPYFRELAKKEREALGEDLYKDMPPSRTLQGTSIDITPEMREKIQTRGQPLFVVPPAAGAAALMSEEEEPVQEFKEAGRVEKKKGLAKEQFDSPFDETRRIGPKPGVSKGPASIRSLTKILRGEDTETKNIERQRIAGNVKAGEEFGEYMYDMLVPQTPWEFALEAAFGPVGKLGRKGLLAVSGAMYDPDAEAGRIRLLHGSPSKIDRLEEGRELWASTDPEYALKRAMDKMRFAQGAQGPGYLNQFEMEDTDLMRLVDKYSPEEIEVARRAFSKLPQGREVTGEEIYELASTNTGGAKTAALENVTRALGKKGYQVPAGADDKGEWYRVLDQTDLERFGKGGAIKSASEAISAAAKSAGAKKAPFTAEKELTTIEDTYTSLADRVKERVGEANRMMENFSYSYEPGEFVFTKQGAAKNLHPLEIIARVRAGNNPVYKVQGDLGSGRVIDPATGKTKRTPYEPGYIVRQKFDDGYNEFIIPESAIRGKFGRGGKVVDALKDAFKMTDEAPDPSRRKAIGLREKIVQPGALTTIEKEVSASDLDTLQKAMGNVGEAILNEPVSRREVLKRGALSAGSNLIPGGGAFTQIAKEMVPKMLDVTEPALSSKTKVGITPTIQGAIARAFREGVDDELEIVDLLLDEFPDIDAEELIDFVIPAMRDPYNAVDYGSQVAAMGPLEYLNRSLGYPGTNELRPILREIKDTDFLLYNQLKEAARRNDEMIAKRTPGTTYERRLRDARAMAKKGGYPFNMQKFRERYGYPKDFDPNAPKKRKKKAD